MMLHNLWIVSFSFWVSFLKHWEINKVIEFEIYFVFLRLAFYTAALNEFYRRENLMNWWTWFAHQQVEREAKGSKTKMIVVDLSLKKTLDE